MGSENQTEGIQNKPLLRRGCGHSVPLSETKYHYIIHYLNDVGIDVCNTLWRRMLLFFRVLGQ